MSKPKTLDIVILQPCGVRTSDEPGAPLESGKPGDKMTIPKDYAHELVGFGRAAWPDSPEAAAAGGPAPKKRAGRPKKETAED